MRKRLAIAAIALIVLADVALLAFGGRVLIGETPVDPRKLTARIRLTDSHEGTLMSDASELAVWAQVAAAALGGLLAAGTGAWLQSRQERLRLKKLRDMFLVLVKDDLTHALPLYEKLHDDWKKSSTIWFETTQQFEASREAVLKNREWAALLDDADLRSELTRYYMRSSHTVNMLAVNQRRKYDLDAKFSELRTKLRLADPSLSPDDANKRALELMDTEYVEFQRIDPAINALLADLHKRTGEANALLTRLKAFT